MFGRCNKYGCGPYYPYPRPYRPYCTGRYCGYRPYPVPYYGYGRCGLGGCRRRYY